jgi:L-alanine-DL-glutamate epimerase-like enolase superfamily enzyme
VAAGPGPGTRTRRAIFAVDTALWDLKATLLGLPVSRLLGQAVPNLRHLE